MMNEMPPLNRDRYSPPGADAPVENGGETGKRGWSWSRICTTAGLMVLGVTPWAQAQIQQPDLPTICPPLTAFATPTLFDVFFGTTPIRFPYQ